MVKKTIKTMLEKLPLSRKLMQYRREKRILTEFGANNRQELFTHYFETGKWDSEESVSGPGSTIEYTENIRKEIPHLLEKLDVKQILDAPCGDYNWFRLIQREDNIGYLGGDIVEPLVKRNKEKYRNQSTDFIHIDILKDDLPESDMWLCRDCLFHLSNEDIFRAIDNYLNSSIKYLLTSTHPECEENADIATGRFREINLELPPFSFGEPLFAIDDWIEGFPVRRLALWEKRRLTEILMTNKEFQLYQKSYGIR